MLFNSLPFVLVFLPSALLVYYAGVDRFRPKVLLLLLSALFYGLAQPNAVPFLGASILANWYFGRKSRKSWLVAGIALNLGFLCWFKYLNFFLDLLGLHSQALSHWQPAFFPLGISFFTLQQIMYLTDCYEGGLPAHNLLDHAVFTSFFAYITAGPITKAQVLVPQLDAGDLRTANYDRLARGTFLFVLGLSKKVILADNLAFLGARLSGLDSPYMADAWAVTLAYTLQIYFDFSGYSDMARAVALLFNLEIPRNFNTPFKALSIAEFWERWHMTLSIFIKGYLFTPMLRSMRKVTPLRAAAAIIVTMFLVGLWHGPALTFAVFGTLHGLALAANQRWKKAWRSLPAWAAWGATFGFVNLTFVFFRAPGLGAALHSLARMSGPAAGLSALGHSSLTAFDLLWLMAGMLLGCTGANSDRLMEEFRFSWRSAAAAAVLAAACCVFLNSNVAKGFIYRDF